MGCGCGGGAKAANAAVQRYEIVNDPDAKKYLTEREALTAAVARSLPPVVVPSQ